MPELNLGKVVGPQGPQGQTGPAGAQGEQGIQGVPGKDATINGYNVLNLTAAGAAQLTQDGGNAVITASAKNLLDNAYFANIDSIIDQRKGYILVKDAIYYSDTALSADPVTVTAYTTVYNVVEGDGYTSFKLSTASDAVTYYAAPTDVVRGYVTRDRTFFIDRWMSWGSGHVALLEENGVRFIPNTTGWTLKQTVENFKRLQGETVTFSILFEADGEADNNIRALINHYGGSGEKTAYSAWAVKGFASVTTTLPSNLSESTSGRIWLIMDVGNKAKTPTLKAFKLDLGSTQTLAHQDADGNWVLNDPPPDKALELAKCQRYFYGSLAAYFMHTNTGPNFDTWALICNFPTTMRATPSIPKEDIPVSVLGNGASNTVATLKYSLGANVNRLVHAHLTPDNTLDKTKIYSGTVRNISAEL